MRHVRHLNKTLLIYLCACVVGYTFKLIRIVLPLHGTELPWWNVRVRSTCCRDCRKCDRGHDDLSVPL